MACQTQGIQQLLAAEKIAAEKVAEARKRKQKRLKQAKDESKDELERYRNMREKQFREYEASRMGCKEDIKAKIDEEADKKIVEINESVANLKEPLIQELISLVVDIRPEIHKNFIYVCGSKRVLNM